MSDGLGGEEAGSVPAEPEIDVPRAVTTATGTVAYTGSPRPDPEPGDDEGASGLPSTPAPAPAAPLTRAERRRAKRIAYWNRPKPPKDWRYWVGGTGRVLIVLGLLMFAFVAYQLWGTGIEQARAQNQLENELEERRAALGTIPVAPATTAPATTAPDPTPTETTPPETTPETVAPTDAPPSSLPPITEGDAIGQLRIPRIGMSQIVVAGVSVRDLKKAPGHFPETPPPGSLGNAAIAGHRTTYGEPFRHLDELDPGDEIVWEDLYGQQFVYLVTGSEVVRPSQGEVINTVDEDRATMVLITCDPPGTSSKRLVVYAELAPDRSPTPADIDPFYGQGVGTPISELPSEEAPDDTDGPDATTGSPDDDTDATSAPATPDADDTDRPAGFSDTDPFAQGWFSDTAAWPHILMWGLGLVAVVIACYALARALMRRWVGWVVAAAPFTFLLYFFFQNVNRLLPPGL